MNSRARFVIAAIDNAVFASTIRNTALTLSRSSFLTPPPTAAPTMTPTNFPTKAPTKYCPGNGCVSGWVHKTFRSCASTTLPGLADKCVGVPNFTLVSGISGCAATGFPELQCWNSDDNYQCCEGAGTIHDVAKDYCPGNSCDAGWTSHSATCPDGSPAACWNTDNNCKCC